MQRRDCLISRNAPLKARDVSRAIFKEFIKNLIDSKNPERFYTEEYSVFGCENSVSV